MDYGMKVALDGYDVMSATPEQCAIHSGFASPKLDYYATPAHSGAVHLRFLNNPPSEIDTVIWSVPHAYSYTPMTLASMSYTENNLIYPLTGISTIAIGATLFLFARATPTHFEIVANVSTDVWDLVSLGASLTFSYNIYAESTT